MIHLRPAVLKLPSEMEPLQQYQVIKKNAFLTFGLALKLVTIFLFVLITQMQSVRCSVRFLPCFIFRLIQVVDSV